jgi:hypothetical protein
VSFVIRAREEDHPETPEALFRSLRPRDRAVRDLLLRQGDVLRDYAALSSDESDVAVELTTGGGKTLVGLLIAEWRRRALRQRVAYLCPTVQLANQVAGKAYDYGLDVVTLVRRQASWDPADFNRFQRGQAIAIAGYSQVFNSNPRLNSAQTLVLDDAHAAEDAVASNWSISAARGSLLYSAVLAALLPYVPDASRRRLQQDDVHPSHRPTVSLVPPEAMPHAAPALDDALSEYATERDDPNTYTKRMIGTQLERCLAFVSWSEILIRPMIPPTSEHQAFAAAQQRVYMSATLGSAGELQRAFGVTRIAQLAPQPTQEPGFGRRFFVMPDAARYRPDEVTAAAVARAGRALILAPSNLEADDAASRLVPEGVPVLRPADVEQDFAPFVDVDPAVLLLANRYDGIDLPDDACRLIVLTGLPAYAHLQERFIMDVLGARRVLSERIRTRIQQGAGRATRNARDFAAVIIRGDRLTDFLSREEEVRSFPPQLQAEIGFGFDNSEDANADVGMALESFWEQGPEWQPAEQALISDTARLTRTVTPTDRALAASAEKEVACWRAVFTDDLPRAVDLAQEVTDRLIGGEDLRSYRALWFYLASAWASMLAIQDPERWQGRADELRREAEGTARTLRWTPRWLDSAIDDDPALPEARGAAASATLRKLGIRGGRFEAHLDATAAGLAVDAAPSFEQGLQQLGELLGFESIRPDGQADPDSAWRESDECWILFEAKTEERPDTSLSAETVRQASTHERWVENQLQWERPSQILTIVVTHKENVHPAAAPIAGDVRMTSPEAVREVAELTFEALREVRAAARGLSDSEITSHIIAAFAARGLDSATLMDSLGSRCVSDG